MLRTSYSRYNNGICTVGFRNFRMTVNDNERKMLLTHPHLNIYSLKCNSLEEGQQKIMNHLMATEYNKNKDVKKETINVINNDFETTFDKYIEATERFMYKLYNSISSYTIFTDHSDIVVDCSKKPNGRNHWTIGMNMNDIKEYYSMQGCHELFRYNIDLVVT